MKAVTFSYDDGVTQDRRLVEMFNKYGLKATFNINSSLLGNKNFLTRGGVQVCHDKISAAELAGLYDGHEVAAHTLTHPDLTKLPDEEIIRQVEDDRSALSEIVGYEVEGMAYPGGGVNFNRHVAELVENETGIKYARTTVSNYGFDLQEDLFVFSPTIHHFDGRIRELAEEFIALKPDKPQLFYIWGHSYEFDIEDTWSRFEDFCKLIGGRDDIFYATNSQVLLG